jgi:DNA-binding transcriptional LysR family regulator
MLPYIQSIHAQAEAARMRARSIGKMKNVELKIGAMCTLSPTLLADFIVSFQRANGGVDLNVSDGAAKHVLHQLSAGEREIGVIGHPEDVDDRFHAMPLYREDFVIVLPRQHRLANHDSVRVCDLQGEPYVNRVNCEMADFAQHEFARQGVSVRVVFRSERDDWVLGMIGAGMGLGFFPGSCSFPQDVVVRPLVDPALSRTVSLVTVRGRPHSPAVGAFVKAARSFAWPSVKALRAA